MSFHEKILENGSLRWGSSLTFVIGVYTSMTLIALQWPSSPKQAPASPMAAMMVEFAPLPTTISATPSYIDPPGPVQEETPEEPLQKIEPEIKHLPEAPIIKSAEVTLPPKPKPIKKKPQPIKKKIAQKKSALPSVIAPIDNITAAPAEGAVSLTSSNAPVAWQSVLLAHLEKHKHYPRKARRRGHEAVVLVRITINRNGTVINTKLTKQCPYRTLNHETLSLISRAQSLPPPPVEIKGKTVEFIVPIVFSLS